MDDDQFELFGTTTTNTHPTPPCTLCGQPRRWLHKRQEYARYCGGQSCNSPDRICIQCGNRFTMGIGMAGTKLCSAECIRQRAINRSRSDRPLPTCAWCNSTLRTHNPRTLTGQPLCNDCLEPIAKVLGRLRAHHVPADLVREFAANPACQICGIDVLTPTLNKDGQYRSLLVIDHDHTCCPGAHSCGKCVRGFVCGNCNILLGCSLDNPTTLDQAATYLRHWAQR